MSYGQIIKREIDSSYVIEQGGYPYHVPNEGEFAPLWAKVDAYAQEHPQRVTLESAPLPEQACGAVSVINP